MILDNQTLLSNDQAITVTAASTNIIDLSPIASGLVLDIGPGNPIPILIQATAAFAAAGAATLTVSVQVDSDSTFGSPKTVATSAAIPVAGLVAGYQVNLDYIPRGTNERYLRLNYAVVTGPMTAGTIKAGVLFGGHQTNG